MARGGVAVASAARRAGRFGLVVGLIVALLPACQPERLLLITVTGEKSLSDVGIATLEARTSFTNFQLGPHEDLTGDGGATKLPAILGLYLKESSGTMNVQVFAYALYDRLVAAGRRDIALTDERQQKFRDELLLYSCTGEVPRPLCPLPAPPDGGAEAGNRRHSLRRRHDSPGVHGLLHGGHRGLSNVVFGKANAV